MVLIAKFNTKSTYNITVYMVKCKVYKAFTKRAKQLDNMRQNEKQKILKGQKCTHSHIHAYERFNV